MGFLSDRRSAKKRIVSSSVHNPTFRSSQKMELDAYAREAAMRKAEAEFFALDTRLNRGHLRRRASIRKEVERIVGQRGCRRFLNVTIASQIRITTKYLRRGRPKTGDPVREIHTRVFHLQVHRDKEALRLEARTDGVFPLATNLKSGKASKKEVLFIYKYQLYVEKRHGIESLPILPEGRPTKTPTTARLLEIFSGVSWYEFQRGGETVTFPIRLSPLQKLLLRLLDMDLSGYT